MALNVSLLDLPWPVYLSAFVLVAAVIIVLAMVERRLSRGAKAKKEYEDTYYQNKLSATIALKSDPNAFLISLDKAAREFFSEVLGLQRMARYSELIDKLGQARRTNSAAFCQDMQEALYSGEMINQKILLSLHDRLRFFVLKKERADAQNKPRARSPVKTPLVEAQSAKNQANETTLNSNILRYASEGRRREFSVEALKEKLLSAGFDEHEIDKVFTHLSQKAPATMEKSRMPGSTEKRILTSFFNPKSNDLEVIKKGIEEKDEVGHAEIIEIVPYAKEELPKRKVVEYPKREPKRYGQIGNMDDLDRVREKIKSRRQGIVSG